MLTSERTLEILTPLSTKVSSSVLLLRSFCLIHVYEKTKKPINQLLTSVAKLENCSFCCCFPFLSWAKELADFLFVCVFVF